MFSPAYTISHRLLASLKRLAVLTSELNHQSFPQPLLDDAGLKARAVILHANAQLEGGTLTLAEVRQLLKSPPDRPGAQEREMLQSALALEQTHEQNPEKNQEQPLSLSTLIGLHRSLQPGAEGLRQESLFVRAPRQEQILYWPPDPQDLPGLLAELLDFVSAQRNSLDPILLAGLFHKQALMLQPFAQANGLTIRLATRSLLGGMDLRLISLLSPERSFAQNPGRYWQMAGSLGNYAEIRERIDFTSWLEYFSEALVEELTRLSQELRRAAVTPETSPQPVHQVILVWLSEHGYISDKDYARLTNRAKATRALDFRRLQDLGLIERKGHGKNTYYVLSRDPD